ncbi:MAG TPA: hypothetical protein VGS10_08530 [Terracidiphilus sp.]|nr:hypothetical protein [Terracidiphilus sp.]
MISMKPPLPVIVVALLYLAVGAIGFVYHFRTLLAWQQGSMWVEGTELLAVIIAVFLLRGQNWARWLAIAWMAFHVVLSALHSYGQAAVHAAFLVLIAWALFMPASGHYFRRTAAIPE